MMPGKRTLASMALLCLLLAIPAVEALPPAPRLDVGRLHFPASRDINNTTGNGTDLTPPTITILSHTDREIVKENGITLRGTASDNSSGVQSVLVRLNGRDWVTASGNTSWSVRLTLDEGWNAIMVKAVDYDGNEGNISLALVLTTGTKDNSGIILAGAMIVPIVVLVVLFSTRKKKAPADGAEGGDGGGEEPRSLGEQAGGEASDSAELGDAEEVTRLENGPVVKKGG